VRHSIVRVFLVLAEIKPLGFGTMKRFGKFGPSVRKHKRLDSASETGYRFPNVSLKRDSALRRTSRGGDESEDEPLATFNPLFPRANYFGVLATAGPGPINFIDVHPRAEATLPHSVTASVDGSFSGGRVCEMECILSRISDYSGRKSNHASSDTVQATKCAGRRIVTCGFKPDLRNFLRGQVCQRESARPQPQLLGIVEPATKF